MWAYSHPHYNSIRPSYRLLIWFRARLDMQTVFNNPYNDELIFCLNHGDFKPFLDLKSSQMSQLALPDLFKSICHSKKYDLQSDLRPIVSRPKIV